MLFVKKIFDINWWRAKTPTRKSIETHYLLKHLLPYFADNNLWQWSRRGVALGVAFGMFFGVLLPFFQIPATVILALFLRYNIPISSLVTFVSNPLTTPFIYYTAYKFGLLLSGDTYNHIHRQLINQTTSATTIREHVIGFLVQVWGFISQMGFPLVYGLITFSIIAGIISYIVTNYSWIYIVRKKRKKRKIKLITL